MTRQEALRILSLAEDADEQMIKKKYRQLMHTFHPDAMVAKSGEEAASINTAYAILTGKAEAENPYFKKTERATAKKKKKKAPIYKAPINENAYCERNILHSAEDSEGEQIGDFCVARGKYLWTKEEDFRLFLKSLYGCAKELLEAEDEKLGRSKPDATKLPFLGELTYLLSGQFLDGRMALHQFATEEMSEDGVLHLTAMLERTKEAEMANCECVDLEVLQPGELLYPKGIKKHRLYLRDSEHKLAGYVSFLDDRLYYVVIPLLELKSVKVKIQVAQRQEERKRLRFLYLDFWMQFPKEQSTTFPESIRHKIEELLTAYAKI